MREGPKAPSQIRAKQTREIRRARPLAWLAFAGLLHLLMAMPGTPPGPTGIGTRPQVGATLVPVGRVGGDLLQSSIYGISGGVSFSSVPDANIPPGRAMIVQFRSGATASVKGIYANGSPGAAYSMIAAGDTYTFRNPGDGTGWIGVHLSAADSNIVGDIVPDGPYPFFRAGLTSASSDLYNIPPSAIVDATLISAIVSLNYPGAYFSARSTYNVGTSGNPWVIDGLNDFIFESQYGGSIGYSGTIYQPKTYLSMQSGAGKDGVQIYGTTTAGIVFRQIAFVGANSAANVVHLGGGQRAIVFDHCFFQQTTSTAGSYACVIDTALLDDNSENSSFDTCFFASSDNALGMGIGDQTQHANDTLYQDCRTAAASTSVTVASTDGNHQFSNFYDRSNPSGAIFSIAGGSVYMYGGELQSTTCPAVSMTGGAFTLIGGSITQAGAQTTVISITGAANFYAVGHVVFNASPVISCTSSSANIDFSNFGVDAHQASFAASSVGTLVLPTQPVNGFPTLTNWTGTLLFNYNGDYETLRGSTQTTTQTLTFTPPKVTLNWEARVWIHVVTVGTSTIPAISFTRLGAQAVTAQPITMTSGTTVTTTCEEVGEHTGTYPFTTDNSGSTITLTITPTGSTFTFSIAINPLGSP